MVISWRLWDYLEDRNIKISPGEWAKHQLHYVDGRFSGDKTWSFYALNYVQRRRNMSQGGWFASNFYEDEDINSVEELQKKIDQQGNKYI